MYNLQVGISIFARTKLSSIVLLTGCPRPFPLMMPCFRFSRRIHYFKAARMDRKLKCQNIPCLQICDNLFTNCINRFLSVYFIVFSSFGVFMFKGCKICWASTKELLVANKWLQCGIWWVHGNNFGPVFVINGSPNWCKVSVASSFGLVSLVLVGWYKIPNLCIFWV